MSTFAKGNILLIGVDVAHNRFLCSTVPELLGPLFVDTKTHLSFGVNFGSGQISIHAAQPLPRWPSGWVGASGLFGTLTTDGPPCATQAAEPNHPTRNMHVCTNDYIQSLAGVKVDHNIFICVNDVVAR